MIAFLIFCKSESSTAEETRHVCKVDVVVQQKLTNMSDVAN